MERAVVREEFERQWRPWRATLAAVAPADTREPGVCGPWTIHDVVGHVQAYVRYHLVQAQAAFSHQVPASRAVNGDREEQPIGKNTTEARNEAIRVSGLSLGWQQLLDESEWLRAATLDWLGQFRPDQLDEPVGWVEFWDPDFPGELPDDLPLHVRRVRDVPAARDPLPVWQFVLPDKPPDRHLTEHLTQLRTWLAGRA